MSDQEVSMAAAAENRNLAQRPAAPPAHSIPKAKALISLFPDSSSAKLSTKPSEFQKTPSSFPPPSPPPPFQRSGPPSPLTLAPTPTEAHHAERANNGDTTLNPWLGNHGPSCWPYIYLSCLRVGEGGGGVMGSSDYCRECHDDHH